MMAQTKTSEDSQIKSLDWISISNDVKENLDLLPHSLTDIELYIISGMLEEGAITTRGVWKRAVHKKFQFEFMDYRKELVESKKGLKDKVKDLITPQEKGEYKSFLTFSQATRKLPISEKKAFDTLKTALKSRDYNIPTYEKTLNNLEALEDQNLVIRRRGKNVNAKYLWSINPKFLKIYKERKREVVKRVSEILSSGGSLRSEFDDRTLFLYNIPSVQS